MRNTQSNSLRIRAEKKRLEDLESIKDYLTTRTEEELIELLKKALDSKDQYLISWAKQKILILNSCFTPAPLDQINLSSMRQAD